MVKFPHPPVFTHHVMNITGEAKENPTHSRMSFRDPATEYGTRGAVMAVTEHQSLLGIKSLTPNPSFLDLFILLT
jgi:hypothetical protein